MSQEPGTLSDAAEAGVVSLRTGPIAFSGLYRLQKNSSGGGYGLQPVHWIQQNERGFSPGRTRFAYFNQGPGFSRSLCRPNPQPSNGFSLKNSPPSRAPASLQKSGKCL